MARAVGSAGHSATLRCNWILGEQRSQRMAREVADSFERGGLPYLAHAPNGWGDVHFQGRPLTARLHPVVQCDRSCASMGRRR